MRYFILSLLAFPSSFVHAGFPDVSPHSELADAINYVQAQGIVAGYPDGNYRPSWNLNRAEFTKIILEATAIPTAGCELDGRFSDVASEAWFAPYVCAAAERNIIRGYGDGTFRPGETINFVEAAKIVALSFGSSVETHEIWYKPYVTYLEELGASPSTVKILDQKVTRGELAEMVYRLKTQKRNKATTAFFAQPEPVVAAVPTPTPVVTLEPVVEPVPETEPVPEVTPAPEPIVETSLPTVVAEGNFKGRDSAHKGSGEVIVTEQDGQYFLDFNNFSVTNGPDLYVALVEDPDPQNGKAVLDGWKSVSLLKSITGNQSYTLPAGINPSDYGSVIIYCKAYSVVFSVATLQ